MAKKLIEIEGIGNVCAEKLAKAKISTQEDLLKQAATPAGRKDIAEKCSLSEKQILGWTNRADLARVKGVGEEYGDLLEHAGVDTVPELAQRNAANLYTKIKQVNEERKLTRALPAQSQVEQWITQAKGLPPAISY